jgi:transcriptional regulator with XRE-family HTH domain
MIEATQVKKIQPSVARAQLGLRQIDLAERSGISQKTISAGENGAPIRLLSATAILKALNEERVKQGMNVLEFEEVDWKIE